MNFVLLAQSGMLLKEIGIRNLFVLHETLPLFLMQEATKLVQPSSRREGFSTIPDVKWEDVGGLDSIRDELNRHIVRRIQDRENYEVSVYHMLSPSVICIHFLSSLENGHKRPGAWIY